MAFLRRIVQHVCTRWVLELPAIQASFGKCPGRSSSLAHGLLSACKNDSISLLASQCRRRSLGITCAPGWPCCSFANVGYPLYRRVCGRSIGVVVDNSPPLRMKSTPPLPVYELDQIPGCCVVECVTIKLLIFPQKKTTQVEGTLDITDDYLSDYLTKAGTARWSGIGDGTAKTKVAIALLNINRLAANNFGQDNAGPSPPACPPPSVTTR